MTVLPVAEPSAMTVLWSGVVVLSLLWWWSTRRPSGAPPGPGPALPLIGHLYLFGKKHPKDMFTKWRKQYGDIFSLYMGTRFAVVLNGYDAIKEAFVKMGDVTSDRPHCFVTDTLARQKGLIFSSGETSKEQRWVTLKILRHLGMSQNSLAQKIQEEVNYYLRAVEDLQGAPTDLKTITKVSVSNNISSIIFGQRFQYDDSEFIDYLHAVDEFVTYVGMSGPINFFPKAERWPGDPFNARKLIKAVNTVLSTFFQKQIDYHKKTFNDRTSDDFMYSYIEEMKELQKSDTRTTLTDENFLRTTMDLFLGGSETTIVALNWLLLYMLHNPEVQEKCYQEICKVVGTSRPPDMADKPDMPYVEATIWETLRVGQVAPLGVFHSCTADIKLGGYHIPRGTMLFSALASTMTDPSRWGDPENFRPERFIGPDGKFVKREELIPFSIGRRVCIGEILAKTEMFLYTTNLFQRFQFYPEDPYNLPPLDGIASATYAPKPYKIKAVLRN